MKGTIKSFRGVLVANSYIGNNRSYVSPAVEAWLKTKQHHDIIRDTFDLSCNRFMAVLNLRHPFDLNTKAL